MVAHESLDTVSYSHPIATMAVSLAVSTQYTNVTDRHPARHSTIARARHAALLGCSRAEKSDWIYTLTLCTLSNVP